MWIDDKGVVHTVALPHPKTRVDRDFRKFLKANCDGIDEHFFESLGDLTFDEVLENAASLDTAALVGEPFPAETKIGAEVPIGGATVEVAIARAIAALPLVWRVDAVGILEDLIDEWD